MSALGSTDSKGNIFLPKPKQNEGPPKNFCLSSKTFTSDLPVRLRVEGVAGRPECCPRERRADWSAAQSPVTRSHRGSHDCGVNKGNAALRFP